jgi:peptide/nickel transport system permease protein
VGGIIVGLMTLMAVFAPWLAPYHPTDDANLMYAQESPSRQFLFGTDAQGRDILSRVIFGARISLSVGLVSQGLNSLIGVILGLTAGFFGRWWDDLVMGLTNIMLSIPSLIFALAIVALLGPGLLNVFIALGFTNWSYSCRITRSQVLTTRSLEYVQAARALGYGRFRLMFTQILPNILGPILVIATLGVAGAILLEASLSFLGLGVQPPTPSWGSMLSQARDQLFTAPWVSLFPGLAIFITVLGLNLLGDGLRDVLDPHTNLQRR